MPEDNPTPVKDSGSGGFAALGLLVVVGLIAFLVWQTMGSRAKVKDVKFAGVHQGRLTGIDTILPGGTKDSFNFATAEAKRAWISGQGGHDGAGTTLAGQPYTIDLTQAIQKTSTDETPT
jgi:hypothetical protein